jgi:PEP-CTERM motif
VTRCHQRLEIGSEKKAMHLKMLALFAIGLVSAPLTLAAATLTETVSSTFGGNVAMVPDFDPSLGTLDGVSVTIEGNLDLSVLTSPNLVPEGPGVFAPIPYMYSAEVGPQYTGQLFRSIPAGLPSSATGTADGLGDLSSASAFVDENFQFNALSNLTGLDIEGTATGKLSSFISPVAGANLPLAEIMTPPLFVQTQGLPVLLVMSSFDGAMSVEYIYTPPTSPVPLPSSLTLFVLGLAGVGFWQRRLTRSGRA